MMIVSWRGELEIMRLGWFSDPAPMGADLLTVPEGTFFPGEEHSFH
jgi:hypothetical protein